MAGKMDIPTLYHSKTSVCSQKVRLVLAELDIEWRGIVLDLKKGEQFSQDYMSLNSKASVPTFIGGDICLTESNDIMMFLSQRGNKGAHLTAGIEVVDEVKSWLVESSRFHQSVHVLTTLALNRGKLLSLSPDQLDVKLDRIPDKARAHRIRDIVQFGLEGIVATSAIIYLKNIYQKLDTRLEQNAYLCGDRFSLADLAILPFVMRIKFLQLTPDWSVATFHNLDRWVERLQGRGSFDAAIMDFHSQEALENYKIRGIPVRKELLNL